VSEEHPTQIFGLIGYPVSHSFSPAMHNAAFKHLGINAKYRLFSIKPDKLEAFFSGDINVQDIYGNDVRAKDIAGFNVTIPYKEIVLKYLQWKSPGVRFTGAVNVVVVKNRNYLKGYNTDGIGFSHHLTKDLKFIPLNKKVIILGAGGAAKAVTDQLARKRVKTIVIYDIDKDKSLKLANRIKEAFPKCNALSVNSIKVLDIKNTDLLINATPIGMKASDPCLINPDKLHSGILVYDLIYNPPETNLLRFAKQRGAAASNGLGMLLYQGARSFELWIERRAPIEVMRKALQQELTRCKT